MDSKQLNINFESLLSNMIVTDYSDLPFLSELHSAIEEILAWSQENDNKISELSKSIKSNIENLMLEDSENPESDFNQLAESFQQLQQFFKGNLSADDLIITQDANKTEEKTNDSSINPMQEPELIASFIEESREHLETCDQELIKLEKNPKEEDSLNSIFRAFHTIKGISGFLSLQEIHSFSHEAENLFTLAKKGDLILSEEVIDTVFEIVDTMKILIDAIEQYFGNGEYPPTNPLVQPLKERIISITSNDQQTPKETNNNAVENVPEVKDIHISKLKKTIMAKEFIKVDAERLDSLIDMIGELVIAESMVAQSKEFKEIASQKLNKHVGQLEKISRELQEIGMSLRMIPLKNTFQKMERIVRDVCKKTGKKINFKITGSDTELDKNVVDKIGDPLLHLVRNAVDHGIESNKEDRLSAGKEENGNVELRAFHKSGNIFIEIEDDGKGLNKELIIQKAIQKGIITSKENLSEKEILNLIMTPGFSTATKVTDVSGRGVGMDVVKRNIEELRGQLNISTTPGKGSIFSIQLPLTLSIIDGMVIRVAGEKYIIPTLSIIESINPENSQISSIMQKENTIKFHDKLIPIVCLKKLFGLNYSQNKLNTSIIIVVEDGSKRIGLVVDEIIGQQQIVIKSLEGSMKDVKGLSGCAIMPDGKVGIILDISGIIEQAKKI